MMAAWAVLLALHAAALAWLLVVLRRRGGPLADRDRPFAVWRAPEILLVVTLVPAVFSFVFAANANMDYVQRFIASGGNVRLAPNSAKERLDVLLRYAPLLAVDAAWLVLSRLLAGGCPAPSAAGVPPALADTPAARAVRDWALPLSLASAALYGLSFPSFVSTAGLAPLAWICLAPLLVVLELAPYRWGVLYGAAAGVLGSMVVNYWLGTFSLVSLQLATLVTLLEYVPFMALALFIARRAGPAAFLVMPAAWTVFDWLRSLGFLGYPWGILGTTQYASTPIIQVASVGGVWMVSFLVLLVNGVAAWLASGAIQGKRRTSAATLLLFACFVATFAWGQWRLYRGGREDAASARVRVALVQQDTDPRKDDYQDTWSILKRLTTDVLPQRPDLVAWSETAFVPNLRRWSAVAPAEHPYAALTHEFLDWQKTIGTWLLTGNDDYELDPATGERLDYNASVLLSPQGERVDTYHKMHLVPFTEYFPWKRQLPGFSTLLQSFDVYLWEPGRRRVVLSTPRIAFSTPICFEDAFPGDVRQFVLSGAQVILNISNDYWSLTEVEGMQHAANAVFRAVENDRPLLRSTASGLTCSVDRVGRIIAQAPFYQQATLVVDVPVSSPPSTLYTRWGDWFPVALAILLALELASGLRRRGATSR